MAKYKSIVTTEAGLSLLENAAYIGGAIQFVALKTGNGTYDGTENLAAATGLKNVRQTFGIGSVSKKGSDMVIRAVIDNDDVTEGYSITEIGLYAKNPDMAEAILFAIIISEEGNEDHFPSYVETPISITLEIFMGITESAEVTFSVLPIEGVYVPVESFNEHIMNTKIHTSVSIGTKEPTECNVLWFNTNINQSGVATVSLDLEEGADNEGIQANIDGEMYAVQNSAGSPKDENGTYSYEIL